MSIWHVIPVVTNTVFLSLFSIECPLLLVLCFGKRTKLRRSKGEIVFLPLIDLLILLLTAVIYTVTLLLTALTFFFKNYEAKFDSEYYIKGQLDVIDHCLTLIFEFLNI